MSAPELSELNELEATIASVDGQDGQVQVPMTVGWLKQVLKEVTAAREAQRALGRVFGDRST